MKIVKRKLNLLLSRFKLRSVEWQARILTTILHRPLKNILFVNKREKKECNSEFRCWRTNPNHPVRHYWISNSIKTIQKKIKIIAVGIKLAGILTTLQRRLSKNIKFVNTQDFSNRCSRGSNLGHLRDRQEYSQLYYNDS